MSLASDGILTSAVISACGKSNEWALALHLLSASSHSLLSTFAWNSVVTACEKSERWQIAVRLFEEMLDSPEMLSTSSLNAALSA
eukprot:5640541-Amphidinium_carterae.1